MALQIGEPAPDFSLQNHHGEQVRLRDFVGRKQVVLVFYPFAFSRVCTGELVQMRDELANVADDSTEVMAISCDPMFSLRIFAEQEGMNFSLCSDFWPHGAVSRAYHTFNDQLGCAERSSFIVDRDGVLNWRVKSDISRPRDLADYRSALAALR